MQNKTVRECIDGRHYWARSIFRHILHDLLASCSKGRELGNLLDVAAWLELPEERRKMLEAEFLAIFEMGYKEEPWPF